AVRRQTLYFCRFVVFRGRQQRKTSPIGFRTARIGFRSKPTNNTCTGGSPSVWRRILAVEIGNSHRQMNLASLLYICAYCPEAPPHPLLFCCSFRPFVFSSVPSPAALVVGFAPF